MEMTKRTYYSLLVREPDGLWAPQFGDFDRAVVAQEGDDMKESGSWVKGSKLKIIAHVSGQAELNKAVAELNANVVLAMIKKANVFEDRMEYDVDMLAKMYGMTNDAATRLHSMLHEEA